MAWTNLRENESDSRREEVRAREKTFRDSVQRSFVHNKCSPIVSSFISLLFLVILRLEACKIDITQI